MIRFYLFIYLFIYLLNNSQGQNFLRNGSFELISACPVGPGQLENAIDWFNPNSSSPDLMHTCCSLPGLSPPSTQGGFEYPINGGNSYSAIYSCSNEREYVESILTSTLLTNNNYCISIFLSNMENYALILDSISIHISDTFLNYFMVGDYVIPISKPSYTFYSGSLDTNGWTNFSFKYFSITNGRYITIGNFKQDVNTSYSVGSGIFNCSGFYIDSVTISQCRPPILGSDTITIFEGDNIIIGDTAKDVAIYSWFPIDGLSNPNEWQTLASPQATTTYTLTKITPCDSTYATKTVEVIGTYLNVYPNPTNENINFSYGIGDRENAIIKLYDCIGRLVYQEKIITSSGTSVINVALSSGVYFLRMESAGEMIETEKIIVN